MKNSYDFEVANFVCKFNDFNLMDLFEEITLNAFYRIDKWKIKNGTFFFKDVKFIEYESDKERIYALTGRFIRNTFLKREQYHDETTGELVQDTKVLPSSPSATFVLILNNHRLIYLKETKHAPTLDMFKSTAETFLKRETKDYLLSLDQGSKKDFIQKYGLPSVRITPLTSEVRLSEFIKSYKKLETVKVTLKVRNDENDHSGFIDVLQEKSDAADSKSTNLLYENKDNGLNKEAITKQLSDLTRQGNQSIRLIGKSNTDETLKGDNENFKIIQSINGLDLKNIAQTGKKLVQRFIKLIDLGQITVPETKSEVIQKLEKHNKSLDLMDNNHDQPR
ncbi:hypothetical protein G9F32_12895 [Acinetobacter sp. 194]|uniref:hypothetical protein n=1 Tax=Acinetobacter shaoyimingii TaxID=2715164 RepID=UPI00140C85D5|nr:hypothetical protein [Acinetobacter shaoyimingii]NHB58907.1 hypothetical protein [Acinetobacter shaoyimingii]